MDIKKKMRDVLIVLTAIAILIAIENIVSYFAPREFETKGAARSMTWQEQDSILMQSVAVDNKTGETLP